MSTLRNALKITAVLLLLFNTHFVLGQIQKDQEVVGGYFRYLHGSEDYDGAIGFQFLFAASDKLSVGLNLESLFGDRVFTGAALPTARYYVLNGKSFRFLTQASAGLGIFLTFDGFIFLNFNLAAGPRSCSPPNWA